MMLIKFVIELFERYQAWCEKHTVYCEPEGRLINKAQRKAMEKMKKKTKRI